MPPIRWTFDALNRFFPGGPLLVLSLSLAQTAVGPMYAADWPQWRGENGSAVWNESGILDSFPETGLEPMWTAPVGPGYSGVTVADGRVYTMDRQLEPERERILCYDAKTGKPLWVYEYPCEYRDLSYPLGPRSSVLITEGRAYALGAMGHIHGLDAATGHVLWKKDLDAVYRIRRLVWGVSGSPLAWKNTVIVPFGGAHGACLAAFDQESGAEVWRSLDDRASYSSPVLVEQAGRVVLLYWSERFLNGIDPDTGRILYRVKTALGADSEPQNVATPVVDGAYLFLGSQFEGSQMFRFSEEELGVELLWHRNPQGGINPTNTTPLVRDGYVYGPTGMGVFHCLEGETGETLWTDERVMPLARCSTVHMAANGGRTWIFNEDGELIVAELSPEACREIARTKILEPTHRLGRRRVAWAQPAFAGVCVFARNDRELVCVDLSGGGRD